ncbi:phosphotransferase enzyme family [Aspergillus terreus]|uniref:Phosphotransferase enzyme family n=1 Tax=Aspergillus terreus TaxID=33178 RepID=A0A5M3YP98_ASPTE|nr:hypothetical protein ATETN484_0002048600 [Aspergillus terreus]GFF15342.1 phosphotransferase enzyme family [Aspergillus terreus]
MDTISSLALQGKDDEFYRRYPSRKRLVDSCLERVSWDALCRYASSKNSGRPCTLLGMSTIGGVYLIRLLSFGDMQWIARVQLEPSTPLSASLLRAEIDTMALVRAKTDIPIPHVFGYEFSDANEIGAAFILMEFLPGPSAMDADGGYETHHGQIPTTKKEEFYREVAGIQVQMASVRLPQIGSITRRNDNSFEVGPIPGLEGPFPTATDYFREWAKQAKFPLPDEGIRSSMAGGPVEEIIESIKNFPRSLQNLANNIAGNNDDGPFPLYHPDFYHSNMIVDHKFRILGIIDWEGASTVPWEIVEPPLFLSKVPLGMDDPNNYHADGTPKDRSVIQRLHESGEYVKFVQAKEEEMGLDRKLSTTLLDSNIQGLAYAIKVYRDPGKLGFYCKILTPFNTS